MNSRRLRRPFVGICVLMVAATTSVAGSQRTKPVDVASVLDSLSIDSSRVFSFAVASVSEHGGVTLDPEHFLLAFIEELPNRIDTLAKTQSAAASIKERLVKALASFPKPPEGTEITSGPRIGQLLINAWQAAMAAGRAQVTADDLLRALTADRGQAGELLREAGVTAEKIGSSR